MVQKCAARWADLAVLFCRYIAQKDIVRIQFLSYFQVDIKNVVKSFKHYFGYFNTLETHSDVSFYNLISIGSLTRNVD